MSFLLRFWGVRGSIPTPGRTTHRIGGNTSCCDIRWGDELFICDAGTGIRELGAELMAAARGPLVAHFFFSRVLRLNLRRRAWATGLTVTAHAVAEDRVAAVGA